MPLVQATITGIPVHIINHYCESIMREPLSGIGGCSLHSIFDPERETFIEGTLALNTRMSDNALRLFRRHQSQVGPGHGFSLGYNQVSKHIEQEQEDAPEDERFASGFSLRGWANTRRLSRVSGRNNEGEEPSNNERARPVEVAVSQSELSQQRADDIAWESIPRGEFIPSNSIVYSNGRQGGDTRPAAPSPFAEFVRTASREGQSRAYQRARAQAQETDRERSERISTAYGAAPWHNSSS